MLLPRVKNVITYGYLRNCLICQLNRRQFSKKIDDNEPIKFSTSPAARQGITPVFRKVNADMPWYQPYSVVTSVAAFLIYFCVLREENDIDTEFNKTLYDRIPGLEKEQLLQSYKFNKEHGKSVTDIEKRLKEIEEEELKQHNASVEVSH